MTPVPPYQDAHTRLPDGLTLAPHGGPPGMDPPPLAVETPPPGAREPTPGVPTDPTPRGVDEQVAPPVVIWTCPSFGCPYQINGAGRDLPEHHDLTVQGMIESHLFRNHPHLSWTPFGGGADADRATPRTSMAAAVKGDLDVMPVVPGGVHASLRALALYLAEAIDALGSAGNPATAARLAQELRTVLTDLARRSNADDDEADAFRAGLSTPVVEARPPADTSWVKTTEPAS